MTQPLVVLLVATRTVALRSLARTVAHGVARIPLSSLASSAPRWTCHAPGARIMGRGCR